MSNDRCPICGYSLGKCQCLYGGTAHPDRDYKKQVVKDHLYLLTPAQLDHLIKLEEHWQTSYKDKQMSEFLTELEHSASKCKYYTESNEKRFLTEFQRGVHAAITGEYITSVTENVGRCTGTKECDVCNCGGVVSRCDHHK